MEVIEFIHETTWNDLPQSARHQARRCLLDTVGAGIGGRATHLSQIIHDFAAANFSGRGAQLWQDGREVSPPGAALANGMTIDALDIHDGHSLTKGHAGAAIVPGLFASISSNIAVGLTGEEFLTALVVGYEIALRAGMALHATSCDYHTSGAWNALGAAALCAKRLGLTSTQTEHALGIAEYHGPRSQMMRCIDHPTMLKDGSGWGAMAGVSAALLAQADFTGAPALTIFSEEVGEIWQDLASHWHITHQYFKPHAVCRWAQPAIEAGLAVQKLHRITPEVIKRIKVHTFHEAIRLNLQFPETTEQAQYSLPFPLASSLVHSRLGVSELSGNALKHPLVIQLSERVELIEDKEFSRRFPSRRFARVEVETYDGDLFDSGVIEPTWEASSPPTDMDLIEKYRWLARNQLTGECISELEQLIWDCAKLDDLSRLLDLMASPTTRG